MKTKRWIVVCLFVSLFLPLSVFGATFDNIVVFGDSMSDNGNIFALSENTIPDASLYWQGRFSNGEVWVEYLAGADFFNCTLADHAYGGAKTGTGTFPADSPGLNTQVTAYVSATPQVPDTALFVIWIGANDMFAIEDPANASAAITTAMVNIQTALEALAVFGVEDILILNLPNLGATPRFNSTQDAGTATAISQSFNSALAQVISTFETANPDVRVYDMNFYDLMNSIVTNPSDYGLTNATEISPNYLVANEWDNSAGYVFWDDIHPTTETHEVIAEVAYDLLNPDGDGDGVPDDLDQCPNTPTGESVDADGCSASQLDGDGDDGDNNDDENGFCFISSLLK